MVWGQNQRNLTSIFTHLSFAEVSNALLSLSYITRDSTQLGIAAAWLVQLHTWQTADMPTHKALKEAEEEAEEEEEEGGEGRVWAGPNGRGAHHRPTDRPRGERGGKYN